MRDDLELAVMRLAWRLDALDKWREKVDAWCSVTDDRLGKMTRAEEIADAVALRMSTTRTLHLSFFAKACAALVGVSSFAAAVKVLFS